MAWLLCIIVLLFGGCEQKSQENQYKEIVSPAAQITSPSTPVTAPPVDQAMPADPHAGLDMSAMGGVIDAPTSQNILAWVDPEGWREEAGKHMRMASFHPVADPQAIDCYIIALAGPAGGLEANLERWLGQLELQPSDDNVQKLLAFAQRLKTKDGLEIKVFDFTRLRPQGNPSDKSMFAAMITLDQTSVFIKMTGTIESLKKNKDNYFKLLSSITRK